MSDEWLHPSACALVIIDVQNDFCHDDGAVARLGYDVAPVRAMMPGIRTLLELAREVGIPRIFARVEHSDWTDTPAWQERGRSSATLDARRVPITQAGTWGAEFFELEPRPDELVITKHRYSAFAYTPLALVLRARQRRTVVLAGAVSHQCVEATARDAINQDVLPVVVSDAVGARDEQLHQGGLRDMAAHLGPVLSVRDIEAAWTGRLSLDGVPQGVGSNRH